MAAHWMNKRRIGYVLAGSAGIMLMAAMSFVLMIMPAGIFQSGIDALGLASIIDTMEPDHAALARPLLSGAVGLLAGIAVTALLLPRRAPIRDMGGVFVEPLHAEEDLGDPELLLAEIQIVDDADAIDPSDHVETAQWTPQLVEQAEHIAIGDPIYVDFSAIRSKRGTPETVDPDAMPPLDALMSRLEQGVRQKAVTGQRNPLPLRASDTHADLRDTLETLRRMASRA